MKKRRQATVTGTLGHFHGPAFRLVCAGLYGVLLALPADANSSVEPPVSTESTLSAASKSAANWGASEIQASLRVFADGQPSRKPGCASGGMPQRSVLLDRDAVTVQIVETGAPSRLLTLREGLLPEVHYLPDGRYVLLVTRSGWVLRLDLVLARLVTEVRVGLASTGAALSAVRADLSSLLVVANAEPHTLVVLDEQLKLVKLLRATDNADRTTSPVAKIRTAKTRSSFIATFTHIPELWEISYNPKAPEIALGLVHDFQYCEGSFVPGYLNPQRSTLPSPAKDFLLSESGNEVMTAHADSDLSYPGASTRMQVTHLDVRRRLTDFVVPGWPVFDTPGETASVPRVDKRTQEFDVRLAEPVGTPVHSNASITGVGCEP